MAKMFLICAAVSCMLVFSAAQSPLLAPAPAPAAQVASPPPALACPCALPAGTYDLTKIDLQATLLATGNCPVDNTDPANQNCNYGYGNTGGCGNVGCYNHGTTNIGSHNTGTLNIGDYNDGSKNIGFWNSGSSNTGCGLDGTNINNIASCYT